MNVTMKNGSVVIDGKSFSGNTVSINGDRVVVDGVVQEGSLVGHVSVTINGDVEHFEIGSGMVRIRGDVRGDVKAHSGDVDVEGTVMGAASTMSGDIEAEVIQGNCSTMSGDITQGVVR